MENLNLVRSLIEIEEKEVKANTALVECYKQKLNLIKSNPMLLELYEEPTPLNGESK